MVHLGIGLRHPVPPTFSAVTYPWVDCIILLPGVYAYCHQGDSFQVSNEINQMSSNGFWNLSERTTFFLQKVSWKFLDVEYEKKT